MKTKVAAFAALLACSSGVSALAVEPQGMPVDAVQRLREDVARGGDEYVPEFPPIIAHLAGTMASVFPVTAPRITSGELRRAGYLLSVDSHGEYQLINRQDGVVLVGRKDVEPILWQIDGERKAENARNEVAALRQRMAKEGDGYVVSVPTTLYSLGASATMGELRKAGYVVDVADNGHYRLTSKDGSISFLPGDLVDAVGVARRLKGQDLLNGIAATSRMF